jgi:hypothetical protein
MKNDTSLMRQLHLLTQSQIHELASAMTEASLCYELKGSESWRQIFRVKTYKYKVGYIGRVYKMLAKMHKSKIEDLARAVSK